jgi:high affinity Mn2+ porin
VTTLDIAPTLAPAATASGADPSDTARTEAEEEQVSIHGQATFIEQYHPAFHSPYTGPLSLDPRSHSDETLSVSVFLGFRLWQRAEFYVDPELLQGFGLSNSTGVAGFTNGEAFKVGSRGPIGKISRVFLRQTFSLGDTKGVMESEPNQLVDNRPVDRITFTVGKYAVVDIFDDNKFAHDSRAGFLNWTINEWNSEAPVRSAGVEAPRPKCTAYASTDASVSHRRESQFLVDGDEARPKTER